MRILFALLLAPLAAHAEPESLTLDCLASARASYSIVCRDPDLRALAAEDRRLFEHHRTSGLTTPERLLTLQLRNVDGLAQRDHCIGRGAEFDCIAATYAQAIIEHWAWDALPPLENGLTRPPATLTCDGQPDPIYALFLPWTPPLIALSLERRSYLLTGRDLDTEPSFHTSNMALTDLSDTSATLTILNGTFRCAVD